MAKKRAKKKTSGKRVKPVAKRPIRQMSKEKRNLMERYLLWSVVLFIFSYIMYAVSANLILTTIFALASIIFGVLILMFVLIFLVFFFLKIFKK